MPASASAVPARAAAETRATAAAKAARRLMREPAASRELCNSYMRHSLKNRGKRAVLGARGGSEALRAGRPMRRERSGQCVAIGVPRCRGASARHRRVARFMSPALRPRQPRDAGHDRRRPIRRREAPRGERDERRGGDYERREHAPHAQRRRRVVSANQRLGHGQVGHVEARQYRVPVFEPACRNRPALIDRNEIAMRSQCRRRRSPCSPT